MSEYKELHKQKDCLRCQDVKISESQELKRIQVQAGQFIKLNREHEYRAVIEAFNTEAMANLLDLMVFDNAMLDKGRSYRDFKADLVDFVGHLNALEQRKQ